MPKFNISLSVPMAILLAGAIVAGAILYSGSGREAAGVQATKTPTVTPIKIADPSTLFSAQDAVIGNANAKVTIVEFSDFQCPYCRKFFLDTYGQLKKDYIDTGKVRLVFRNYPLASIHDSAESAAIAAQCAKDQGKFWEYHDAIFAQQQKGEASPTAVTKTIEFGVAELKKWASELGLNTAEFNSCLDSQKYADKVAADTAAGAEAGGSGTPRFFINRPLIVGAQPLSQFKTLIDAELKR
jgi:protein-disulfide isomerase